MTQIEALAQAKLCSYYYILLDVSISADATVMMGSKKQTKRNLKCDLKETNTKELIMEIAPGGGLPI